MFKSVIVSLLSIAFLAGSPWESLRTTRAQTQLAGDLNADHVVDFKDVQAFAWQWLDPGCDTPGCKADLDGVNSVNMADFALLAKN